MVSASARTHTVLVGDIHGQLSKLTSVWEQLECKMGREAFTVARVVFLGDYVDRGPESKGVIEWLSSLSRRSPQQEHVFLAGNHDFAMMAFLGLGVTQHLQCDTSAAYNPWRKEPELWQAAEGTHVCAAETMHLQGRRWGALGNSTNRNAFDSAPTFASYGVAEGDRVGLQAALPQSHQRFLADLVWVHECELACDPHRPEIQRLIAVHAGLESSSSVDEQVSALTRRDASKPWIEPLQGRRNVWDVPDDLPNDTLIASGHHGAMSISKRRLIIDSCGGYDERLLSAVILPGEHIVTSIEDEEPELVL